MSKRVQWMIRPLSGEPVAATITSELVDELQHALEDLEQARVDRSLSGEERALAWLKRLVLVEIGQPGEVKP